MRLIRRGDGYVLTEVSIRDLAELQLLLVESGFEVLKVGEAYKWKKEKPNG